MFFNSFFFLLSFRSFPKVKFFSESFYGNYLCTSTSFVKKKKNNQPPEEPREHLGEFQPKNFEQLQFSQKCARVNIVRKVKYLRHL